MTPQEQADLAQLMLDIAEAKRRLYDHASIFLDMPDEQVRHTGHKSKEHGVYAALENARKEIRRLEKAYLKKYPD